MFAPAIFITTVFLLTLLFVSLALRRFLEHHRTELHIEGDKASLSPRSIQLLLKNLRRLEKPSIVRFGCMAGVIIGAIAVYLLQLWNLLSVTT